MEYQAPELPALGSVREKRRAGLGVGDGEGAAVRDDDLAGDGETKAGAASVASSGVVETGEPVEHSCPLVGWNAGAVVGDGELDRRIGFVELHAHDAVRVAFGVVEQVPKYATELVGVAEHLAAGHAG